MSAVSMPAAEAAFEELVAHAVSLHAADGGDLLGCFAAVPDPRAPRGVRHSLAAILAMSTAAVLCGATSLDDVTAWVGSADRRVLAALGCRRNALGILTPPHPDTVIRVFAELGAQGLADHVGRLLARRAGLGPVSFPVDAPGPLPAIAVDGKAVRGAIGPDGHIPYLLAAATHTDSAVIAERLIGPKTNEVPEFAPLLRDLNDHVGLAGHVLTMDAGHTVRAHATFLREELGAHYVMTVKANTPTLYAALNTLDWTAVPIGHRSIYHPEAQTRPTPAVSHPGPAPDPPKQLMTSKNDFAVHPDLAGRAEARDFALWLKNSRKRPRQRRPDAPAPGSVNPVTGKATPGVNYAARTRRHARAVIRSFYEYHREMHGRPLVNPFPKARGVEDEDLNAHHNPMLPFRRSSRRAAYQPKEPKPAPRSIPDQAFNDLFAALVCNRDRALVAFYISTGARAPPRRLCWAGRTMGASRSTGHRSPRTRPPTRATGPSPGGWTTSRRWSSHRA